MSDRPETTNPPIKKQIDMAKESMKAREVKRAKLVAKYAAKKAALKAAGDYEALQLLPKNAQPLLHHRASQRLYAPVWHLAYPVPRNGIGRPDSRSEKGKLVMHADLPRACRRAG